MFGISSYMFVILNFGVLCELHVFVYNVCIVSGAAVQQKGMGGKKIYQVGEVQIVSKIHVWGTKKFTFGEMLNDNFSHYSCSNYDKWCPQFKAAPQELSGDDEKHEYGPLDPHATTYVAS